MFGCLPERQPCKLKGTVQRKKEFKIEEHQGDGRSAGDAPPYEEVKGEKMRTRIRFCRSATG